MPRDRGDTRTFVGLHDRIRLMHTEDPYTMQKSGEFGTVVRIDKLPEYETEPEGQYQVWVEWDSGGKSALIPCKDEFEMIE